MSFISINKNGKSLIWIVIVVICYCNLLEGQNRWTECYTEVRCLLIGIYGASCISMCFFMPILLIFRKILFIFVTKLSNLYITDHLRQTILWETEVQKFTWCHQTAWLLIVRLPILQMLKIWNNSVLLSLSWRFNVNPKKK